MGRLRRIFHILGIEMFIIGLCMLPSAAISYYYGEPFVKPWLITVGAICLAGLILFKVMKSDGMLSGKDSFCIVGLSWIIFSALGTRTSTITKSV